MQRKPPWKWQRRRILAEATTRAVSDFPDRKRAILRAPLHVLLSIPFAAASIAVPSAGERYIAWRKRAEAEDQAAGRDSPKKAAVDLATQTALVRGVLWLWGADWR